MRRPILLTHHLESGPAQSRLLLTYYLANTETEHNGAPVQTASKLYLVLDFVNGGHLFFQLYRQGIFDEDLARLYTAELVLAIAHLHALGIAHRDLKPVSRKS